MSDFKVGNLVVLKSGSMRMCVESVDDDGKVNTVWCNEGQIGRDTFDAALLNTWEHREDSRGGGDDRGGSRSYGGGREGGGKPFGGPRGGRGKPVDDDGPRRRHQDRDDGPPRKTGWDGKPRDKKFYRKDG